MRGHAWKSRLHLRARPRACSTARAAKQRPACATDNSQVLLWVLLICLLTWKLHTSTNSSTHDPPKQRFLCWSALLTKMLCGSQIASSFLQPADRHYWPEVVSEDTNEEVWPGWLSRACRPTAPPGRHLGPNLARCADTSDWLKNRPDRADDARQGLELRWFRSGSLSVR